jgi:hypothetical protein
VPKRPDWLAAEIDQLELLPQMHDALARLKRRTVKGLVALRECDLYDALDADPTVEDRLKQPIVEHTRAILLNMALQWNPEGRFDSFEEVARWTLPAAAELGVSAELTESNMGRPIVKLLFKKPPGEVWIEERVNWVTGGFERIRPFCEVLSYSSAATERSIARCEARAREILRLAERLAAG